MASVTLDTVESHAGDPNIIGTGIAAQVGHLVTNDRVWKTRLAAISHRIAVVRVAEHLPFP